MDDTVNGRHGGHGVFKDPIPFAEDQIGGNEHRFTFIALSTSLLIMRSSLVQILNQTTEVSRCLIGPRIPDCI